LVLSYPEARKHSEIISHAALGLTEKVFRKSTVANSLNTQIPSVFDSVRTGAFIERRQELLTPGQVSISTDIPAPLS
jgi:hypothetical protein